MRCTHCGIVLQLGQPMFWTFKGARHFICPVVFLTPLEYEGLLMASQNAITIRDAEAMNFKKAT